MGLLEWVRKPVPIETNETGMLDLFNSLSDVVLILEDQERIAFINTCWIKMTDIDLNDTIGQPFSDFLHPEDQNSWSQLLGNITNHRSEMIWLRVLHKSGEVRWVEMRIQPMHKDQRYPLSATLCDITPQVRAEQVRNANHRGLQSLVERMPAMLYRSRNNASWTMEYVSAGCEAITGFKPESLLNHAQISLGDLIHPEDAPNVWEKVQKALNTHECFDLYYRIRNASGVEIQVRDKGRGLYSNSGVILGVEGIILTS